MARPNIPTQRGSDTKVMNFCLPLMPIDPFIGIELLPNITLL